ncbi:MAG: hypothetical protein AUJ55_05525 [Proteobacteria bacterium CG1_02_64_396]|nr:MAG: hypothetical protein AUJ55_05525 [Proteobacteria bacterium CG1_02_64_396]
MSDYADLVGQDIRLQLLRLLAQDSDYAVNDTVLGQGLRLLGHDLSNDRVRAELGWLEEVGLVTVQPVGPYRVAQLTQRGLDVAQGRARVEGVRRPGPGEL